MYSRNYAFRYADLDTNGKIKLSTVLDILQDASIFHSSDVGLGLEYLYSRYVAWLLQGWRVKFVEELDVSESVVVKTGIMSARRFEAVRKYEIWQGGVCKIIATAVWFTVDTQKMQVIRTPEDMREAYECLNEPDNEFPFIKLRDVGEVELLGSTRVEQRDLDTNNHMNNVKSAEAIFDFLPQNLKLEELQITYRKQLLKGENINIYGAHVEDGYKAELKNEAGEACVLIRALCHE